MGRLKTPQKAAKDTLAISCIGSYF